ncbi:hypothetical protein ccbrp13_64870 [Ktedonobacteria bacterium brp13]|nr:hypothetical protein ccbrp13_64870 [Ktedonobacteria bacterium brp13]
MAIRRPLVLEQPVALYYIRPVELVDTSLAKLSEQRLWLRAAGWQDDAIIEYVRTEQENKEPFMRLTADIKAKKVGSVFVFSVDRLFPDQQKSELSEFYAACVNANIEIVTPIDRYNLADATDRHMFSTFHDAYTNYVNYQGALKKACQHWDLYKTK